MTFEKQKILVALSGGVDSAVSASILHEQGHEVFAVYVRTWEHEEDLLGECPGAIDLADARAVAEILGIPFEVVNFIDFYKREVVSPMVDGYASGVTPNPDVLCNREMKFGALMNYAKESGFDALATGHYCRRIIGPEGLAELWEGMDDNKDQSYFLAHLSQEQLEYARFPLGEMSKPEVRRLAKEKNLPVAEKKDSQGICFLGKVKVPEFLSNFIEDQPGEIVTTDGRIVGTHKGLHRYTLGQRRGIGVPSNMDNQNFVVTGKDLTSNRLLVAFEDKNESTLWGTDFAASRLSFLSGRVLNSPKRFLGKARYRDPSTPVLVEPIESSGDARLIFEEPQRALTPGQVLALYEGRRLVGAATYSPTALGRASFPLDSNDSNKVG